MHNSKREQQEQMVKDICMTFRRTYTYADVEKRLRKWSRDGSQYARQIPTSRQLISMLKGARWSAVLVEGDKHNPTVYRYEDEVSYR
jgi:hypothetical protein